MKQAFFWCLPSDLEDEGIEASLGRMAGEMGMNAVSILAAHHELREIRPRALSGRKVIEIEAAAHFQPDTKRYVNTRVRPIAAAWMKSRNPLEKIAREAERQGLALRAAMTCCWNTGLAAKYPMATCVNAFGAANRSWLCPSNADVREYIAALAGDLTHNYPLETLELAYPDFGEGAQMQSWLDDGLRPSPADRALWSWCFCSSCRQRAAEAGIDTEEVAQSVRDQLDGAFRLERDEPLSFESLLIKEDSLAAYQAMREECVTSLVRITRARSKGRLIVDCPLPTMVSSARIGKLREHCNGFLATPDLAGRTGPAPTARDIAREAGGADRTEVACYCCPPHVQNGPSLVARVHEAAQSGYTAVGFYSYGLAPEPCLDWVRQAVRYGRRES